MTASPGQSVLPFVHAANYGPDFLAAPSNAAALAWLERSADWPLLRLALSGAGGCGKTHLLHLWAGRYGADVIAGSALRSGFVTAPLAIDDVDGSDEHALLHTINSAGEARLPVLLAAREPPSRWRVSLPDLASRLRATVTVAIEAPEDSLLRALLAKLLAERGLAVPEPAQSLLLLHLPRTAAAVREAASQFDETFGERPMRAARSVLQQMGALGSRVHCNASPKRAALP
ncbi:MAG: chromosomal replication initiator DnaA [Acidisphaera sp.]|nr:chromosomal replication initiator DnaA [Acidisphaera sp.]MBV9812708.1 chromosomal replication initiator DnaA [Acetobacteraceae bacterium]